jgi:hypothetical protein
MSGSAPINSQLASNAPIPSGLVPVTAPILPDQGVLTQMSNFPPQTYNMALGSSIVKLMSAITGPSGGGQLRQRALIDRLRSSVSSTHFTDLDTSLGAVLGISRQLSELLPINPYTTAAPSTGPGSWLAMAEADATYRDRLFQVLRAVNTYGPSALGIKLVAESFLLAPCEVTEYYRGHSTSSITANPALAYYITVTPHVAPNQQQVYGLMNILNKIKPAQATITLAPAPATNPYLSVPLQNAWASSFYWEVQSLSSAPSVYGSTSVPQYAFGSSQAASWTVNGWVSGILSYANAIDGLLLTPSDYEQVTWADGTITNYLPLYAMAPASETVLGTMVVPGNASANPINSDNGSVSPLLLSGASVEAIQAASTITAQSVPQFWSTPERDYTDMTADIIEVRFSSPVNVNAVSFQVANFPCTATFQVYDDTDQTWVGYYGQTVTTSVPAVLPNPTDALAAKTHPQHFGAGHWVSVGFRFAPTSFSRARIVLVRPGITGPSGPISAMTQAPTPYSLGVTEFSFDYVIDSADQLPDQGTVSLEPIGSSTDVAGNTITYSVYSEVPTVKSGALTQWRCFPQPVNNAVVCLYLDARDGSGNPQVIDRFFITPTHLGVGCTLYFAITEPDTPGDMSSLNWILVNRSYMLMTGWVTVPPIAAKYWKFEMSGLVAEPLTNPFPVTADILMFSSNAVNPVTGTAGYQGDIPPGTTTQGTLAAGEGVMVTPGVAPPPPSGTYSPATALVASDPTLAQVLQANFANYGYVDWHPFGATPTTVGGLEDYTTTTLASVNTVGFFCGFSSIVAYRSNPACPIDTALYYEVFYDQSQIASANCQTLGGIYSGPGTPPFPDNNPQAELLSIPAVITSKAYVSASMVQKVQFATNQSPPAEIVPFDTFRNGRYLPPPQGTYTWDDQQDWNIVGMGDSTVNFNAQTLTPIISRGLTAYKGTQANGIVSGQFLTSPTGFLTLAVRLSILSVPPSNPGFFSQYPIYLQLCEWFGGGTAPTVLVEWPLSATSVGQTIEEYFSYQIGSAVGASTFLCLAVAQHSGAYPPAGQNASWVVQAASGFDPSINWAFSSDNSTWVNATSVNPIHNNRNGVVSIPNPSTNLYWRATIYRPDMFVNMLKIRPWYQMSDRPRQAPVMSGPNVSFSDPDQTIWTDPDFNTWTSPVPPWWFAKYQQAALFPDGVPVITPGSRIYTQAITETVGPAHDTAQVTYYRQMYTLPQTVGPANDVATAVLHSFHAGNTETVGPASDVATATVTALVAYTDTYNFTGGAQSFTTPVNLQPGSLVAFSVTGGGGGGSNGGGAGMVTFSFPATPGQVLNIYVGGQGSIIAGPATQGGRVYGYHEGGAPYLLNGANLTYGQPGPYGTVGFGGSSSAVTTSGGTLLGEAGAGGGEGWFFSCGESSVVQNFGFTGGAQYWTLPTNLSGNVTATTNGGGGGANAPANRSVGAAVTATVPSTPGHTLVIYVGGLGGDTPQSVPAPGGWGYGTGGNGGGYGQFQCGGGGGGSTAVVDSSTGTLLLVAGAGGGTGESGGALGGAGGTPNGQKGGDTVSISYGGAGGTQSGPGAGGSTTAPGGQTTGSSGSGPNGGNAANAGAIGDPELGGGGGGGGYFGGGGGGMWNSGSAGQGAAGGGGSSYAIGSATGVSYATQPSAANGTVSLSYITTNVSSPDYNWSVPGGSGGGPNGTAGANTNYGSGFANGGAGATQSGPGAGGSWQQSQPSGTTSGTSPSGSTGGGVNTVNGGEGYPFSGGGGGGGGYTGGGSGGYGLWHAVGAYNTNMWGGGGGGSSWAGNGATNINYFSLGSPSNGVITVSYNTNGPRRYS